MYGSRTIVFEDVWKSYGGVKVVKGVSFSVKPGEIVALLGPNGSGKSTILKMVIGVVRPDRGRVFVAGIDAASDPLTVRRIVGFMSEENVIYESLRLYEFLEFMFSMYEVNVENERISEVLRVLELRGQENKLLGELSHGNKRKALLAVLMLRSPEILVLDEIFTGLDPATAKLVKTWILETARANRPVLISTHILPVAEAVADRVLIIHKGELVAEGRPSELRRLFGARGLEEVFLKVTGYPEEYEEVLKGLYG